MEIERAVEILDPLHRERYDSMKPVNEACRMGQNALLLRVARSPYPDADKEVLGCANCRSGEYLHNEDGWKNHFCGLCGQAIDWGDGNESV